MRRTYTLVLILLAGHSVVTPLRAAATCELQDSVVFIEVTGGGLEKPNTGSGVLIHEKGYVLTAKHLLPLVIDRPKGQTLSITGSVGSRHAQKITLYEAAPLDLATDITLLRFPPGFQNDWCFVTIGEPRDLNIGYEIAGYGFPFNQDFTRKEGEIDSLDGPNASMQMSAGVTPGMSGGPVVDEKDLLVGITVGGFPPYATMNFMMPVHYAKVLLDIPPAHYRDEGDFEGKFAQWNSGDAPVPLGVRAEEGVCFLGKVWGEFNARQDTVGVELQNGEYVLTGEDESADSRHGASARCLWYD